MELTAHLNAVALPALTRGTQALASIATLLCSGYMTCF
jgi:hypothetical protein